MKAVFLLLLLCSYLNNYCQSSWNGTYRIKYKKELKISRESVIRIWVEGDKNNDSLNKKMWSFQAFQRNEMIWEASGFTKQNGENILEFYLEEFESKIPKWEKQVKKKTKKELPYYIVSRVNEDFFIENN